MAGEQYIQKVGETCWSFVIQVPSKKRAKTPFMKWQMGSANVQSQSQQSQLYMVKQ